MRLLVSEIDTQTHQPTMRVITRPNDANPKGDIFGGWLMSQIDIAGSITAQERARGPVSTVAVKNLQFLKPLYVHYLASFYTEITAVGHTSITVNIDVYAKKLYVSLKPKEEAEIIKIAEATFVYVAVEKPGVKRLLD